MKSVLNRFLSELHQLEKYMSYIVSIGSVIKYTPLESDSEIIVNRLEKTKAIISNLPLRKVFEYNSIVISMYGFFEKFIESILVSYLDELCTFVPSYQDLPQSVKENHSILSAQLIQNLKVPKYENENVSVIATKLHNCFVNNKSELNTIAFTDHSSNFRISIINEFFSRIGIKAIGSKIKVDTNFHAYLQERLGTDFNIQITEESIIYNLLNDLVQRRNDISHGTSLDSTILNNSIFPDYTQFLRCFSKSLHDILSDAMLEHECRRDFKSVDPVAIFNHNILCLELSNVRVSIGDKIIVKTGTAGRVSFFARIIEEIQINNQPYNTITLDETITRVGVRLNGGVKKNQLFYIKA